MDPSLSVVGILISAVFFPRELGYLVLGGKPDITAKWLLILLLNYRSYLVAEYMFCGY